MSESPKFKPVLIGGKAPQTAQRMLDGIGAYRQQPQEVKQSTVLRNAIIGQALQGAKQYSDDAFKDAADLAYMRGAASQIAGEAEDQLEHNFLTKAWVQGGFKDQAAATAITQYKLEMAQLIKEKGYLMTPTEFADATKSKREGLLESFNGTTRKAQQGLMSGFLDTQAGLQVSQLEAYSKEIAAQKVRGIAQGFGATFNLAGELMADDPQRMMYQADLSKQISGVMDRDDLSFYDKQDIIAGAAKMAAESGNADLMYITLNQPYTDADGVEHTYMSVLDPIRHSEVISALDKTIKAQNYRYDQQGIVGQDELMQGILNKVNPTPEDFETIDSTLLQAMNDKRLSPNEYLAFKHKYFARMEANKVDTQMTHLYATGQVGRIQMNGGTPSKVAAAYGQMSPDQTDAGLIKWYLEAAVAGNNDAPKRAGAFASRALTGLRRGGEPNEAQLGAIALLTDYVYSGSVDKDTQNRRLESFLSGVDTDDVQFFTEFLNQLEVSGDPASALQTTRDSLSEQSTYKYSREDRLAGVQSIFKIVDERAKVNQTNNGLWANTFRFGEDYRAGKNLVTTGWFSSATNTRQAYVDTTEQANRTKAYMNEQIMSGKIQGSEDFLKATAFRFQDAITGATEDISGNHVTILAHSADSWTKFNPNPEAKDERFKLQDDKGFISNQIGNYIRNIPELSEFQGRLQVRQNQRGDFEIFKIDTQHDNSSVISSGFVVSAEYIENKYADQEFDSLQKADKAMSRANEMRAVSNRTGKPFRSVFLHSKGEAGNLGLGVSKTGTVNSRSGTGQKPDGFDMVITDRLILPRNADTSGIANKWGSDLIQDARYELIKGEGFNPVSYADGNAKYPNAKSVGIGISTLNPAVHEKPEGITSGGRVYYTESQLERMFYKASTVAMQDVEVVLRDFGIQDKVGDRERLLMIGLSYQMGQGNMKKSRGLSTMLKGVLDGKPTHARTGLHATSAYKRAGVDRKAQYDKLLNDIFN